MGSIIDYARTETRGFSIHPFREADALVLAQLSYDDVPDCMPRLEGVESQYGTLRNRVKHFDFRHPFRSIRMLRQPPFDGISIARADDELHHDRAVPDHDVENVGLVDPQVTHDFYHAVASNPRFSDIEMGAFLEQFDGEEQTQFAAVTYLLPSGALVVAYRGTDDSLVGWKEDFNMAFQYPVPAQATAADYLARVAALWKDAPIVLTGHSKGGNLAVYASAFCGEEIQSRIESVYNHDGPGFLSEVVTREGFQRILGRVHTFVPQSSVVGMLLQHEEGCAIVHSTNTWLLQHDLYSWETACNGLVFTEARTRSSRFIDSTLKAWLTQMNPEERGKLVDGVYTALSASGAVTVADLNRPKTAVSVLREMKKLDEPTKAIIQQAVELLSASARENLPVVLERMRKEKE